MGLRGVAGDGGTVVAEIDVGFKAGDALAGDAGALQAADELFGFAGEHGAGDDFEAAGSGFDHENGCQLSVVRCQLGEAVHRLLL